MRPATGGPAGGRTQTLRKAQPRYSGKFIKRLKKIGIRHFDELIHDQPRAWLIENFKERKKKYPLNVTMLMQNLVWQMRERVISGSKPPLNELIRTFWYMYVKSPLSRSGSLSKKSNNQYRALVKVITDLVKKHKLMRYSDIGFRDSKRAYRKVGRHANIILVSEKLGHQVFLKEIADKYDISTIALGGKPSVCSAEHFVDEMRSKGVNLRRKFHIIFIIDHDPHGWIIRDSFIENLNHYGINNIKIVDLIHPDMLTPEEIKISRYRLPQEPGRQWQILNTWLKQVRKKNYKNERYMVEETKKRHYYCGLESESVSSKRLSSKLALEILPLIKKRK